VSGIPFSIAADAMRCFSAPKQPLKRCHTFDAPSSMPSVPKGYLAQFFKTIRTESAWQ